MMLTNQPSMLDLHRQWKAAKQGIEDLFEPLDVIGAAAKSPRVLQLGNCRDGLERKAKQLAAEMLARKPESIEELAVLADLGLSYDVDRSEFDPGAYSTFSHLGILAVHLSRMAPQVEFWSLSHEFTPEARATLLAAAA